MVMAKIIIVLFSLLVIILVISNKLKPNQMTLEREKSTPFECGFDPKHSMRLPFSLRFFILTVVFLIFDIEITILMPLPLILSSLSYSTNIVWHAIIWALLTLGLMFEWKQGALDWM